MWYIQNEISLGPLRKHDFKGFFSDAQKDKDDDFTPKYRSKNFFFHNMFR